MEVPYTDFVLADSLKTAVRLAIGHNNNNHPDVPLTFKYQFDALCQTVAESFRVTLYLEDEVRGSKHVYNSIENKRQVFLRRTHKTFQILSQVDPSLFSRYERAQGEDIELTEEKEEKDYKDEADEFSLETLSRYYDISDPKSFKPVRRNVFLGKKENFAEKFDMVIRCPAKTTDIMHVLGYSAKGLVNLPRSELFTDRIASPIIRVPHGAGICLLTGVQEIFVLDSNFVPLLSINFFQHIVRFIDGLENASLVVLDKPVLSSLKDLITDDIARKYKNLRVGANIVQGECSYDYEDSWGVAKSSTISDMMAKWGVTEPILCVKESNLCMSLNTVDYMLTVMSDYIPETRSVIYTTIERFVNFLYRAGYDGDIPRYESLAEAFVAYQNIKIINSRLVSTNGTCTIDMSPFTPMHRDHHLTLTIQDWRDTKSNQTYTV